jgi:hypothetical protein
VSLVYVLYKFFVVPGFFCVHLNLATEYRYDNYSLNIVLIAFYILILSIAMDFFLKKNKIPNSQVLDECSNTKLETSMTRFWKMLLMILF